MSWQQTYRLLNILANTSSTNEKVSILKKQMDDFSLICFKMALNQTSSYNISIKKFPSFIESSIVVPEEEVLNFLTFLSDKKGATFKDTSTLQNLLTTKDSYEVVKRIIFKDLKCGVDAKTLNKAFPKSVFISPYMRCSTDKEIKNIVYPAYVQTKMDGCFANLVTGEYEGEEYFSTRSGQIISRGSGQLQKLFEGVSEQLHNNYVYNGEFVCLNPDGSEKPRAISNGILNKILHGTASKAEEDSVCYFIWDMIEQNAFFTVRKSLIHYHDRFADVKDFVKRVHDRQIVQVVPYEIANSYEEAFAYYLEMRKLGKEGAVLKNMSASWKDGTSKEQIKLKDVKEAELIITGFNYGKEGGKYEDVVGALCCESACGRVKVDISGFTDEQRTEFMDIKPGQIVTILYNSLTDLKKDGTYSLYLPRYDKLRFDKTTADTLEDLQSR